MHFGLVFIQICKLICSHYHNFSLCFILFRLLYLALLPPLYYHHLQHHHHCHHSVVVTVARWHVSTNSHLQHNSDTQATNWVTKGWVSNYGRGGRCSSKTFRPSLEVTQTTILDVIPALFPGFKLHTTDRLVPRFKLPEPYLHLEMPSELTAKTSV